MYKLVSGTTTSRNTKTVRKVLLESLKLALSVLKLALLKTNHEKKNTEIIKLI